MKKRFFVVIAGLLAAVLILWLLQMLLMPKYVDNIQEGALIREYYDNAGDNDVVFIGDCEVYENFSPITMWEEYGITSVIRGSPQQLIWQSYYLMEETFRYETPDVMVFNVLSMKYNTNESTGSASVREAYNRMSLDGMRWSQSKIDAIHASMTDEEREKEGMWTYLFPLLRYHDRWSELTSEDFRYWFDQPQIGHNGYLMQVGVKPVGDPHMERPLIDYSFADNCWEYLDKMRLLCEENGTQFVLVKAPSLAPMWWDQWDQQIEAYAEKHNLLYVNLLDYQEEIGIDWQTDTYDTGLHLNVYGAEKASVFFGKLLQEKCGLEDRRSDAELSQIWQEKVEAYDACKERLEAEYAAQKDK